MCENEASEQQAVDIEAALRWADRHEARERQKLRDMGLPPEGDMPVTGAFFVRGLVAMLRTAAPTAPSTAAGEDRGEVVREAIASVFDKGSDEIIALRDASSFHSVSHDALTTYASNLAGWAQQIRDMPLPPPSPPWQEQAAQIRREALEEAARLCDAVARECNPVANEYMRGCKNEALSLAERFRALAADQEQRRDE